MNQYKNRVALKPTQKPVIFESARAMDSIDLEYRQPTNDERFQDFQAPKFDFTLFKQEEQQNDWGIYPSSPMDLQSREINNIVVVPKQFIDKKIQVNIEESLTRIKKEELTEMFSNTDLILMQQHLNACQKIIKKHQILGSQPDKVSSKVSDKFDYLDSSSSQSQQQKENQIPSFHLYSDNPSPQINKIQHRVIDSKSSQSSSYSQLHGNNNLRNRSPIAGAQREKSKSADRHSQIISDKKHNHFKEQIQSYQRINTEPQQDIRSQTRLNTLPQQKNIKIQQQKSNQVQQKSNQVQQKKPQYLNIKQKNKTPTKSNQIIVTTPKKQSISTTKKRPLDLTQNFDNNQSTNAHGSPQPQYIMLDFTKKNPQQNLFKQVQIQNKNSPRNIKKIENQQFLEPYIKVDMTLDDLIKNYDQNENY